MKKHDLLSTSCMRMLAQKQKEVTGATCSRLFESVRWKDVICSARFLSTKKGRYALFVSSALDDNHSDPE
jgi:hypothetical protein